MSVAQVLATFLPYLLSAPLLPLAILAVAVLTLSTLAAADTTVQERQQQRQKEESGEAVTLTKAHALGFGFVASVGLLAMWMWSNVLGIGLFEQSRRRRRRHIGRVTLIWTMLYRCTIVYLSLLTFGLGSFVSIQQCMPGIMKRLGLEQGQQWHYNTIAGLLVMSWFWYRNSSHSWIFQDILGGFTITLMLKVLKAPSMSSPTLLLLTAFVYDVFFVFVTPYLTKSGESIMEAAATGAAMTVKENIPMLFRIPSFSPNGGEAILGFGDVVLPGILVTFLKECDARLEEDQNPAGLVSLIGIDLPKTIILQAPPCQTKKFWWRKRWSYHLTAILGYAAGLEVTFIAMMWSNKGQPALLYLVPCTIIPVVILASKRHELSLLWHGWGELESEALLVDVDKDDDDNEQRDKDGKLLESIERKPKPVTLDL
ncbi:Signal peptide peptidase-like 2A [Modicella reniformis]|uniref:Signal peptide peptidase-like 2A n=1 Tax=Modicella reniformis TaxID=1440133 RepID=A0A9P6IP31_9FUNG|nr:Signal peptide peptidase-like 2A [Modicella reniformis]